MNAAAKSPAIGFLTVVEHAEFGLFGGYLILNVAGRPLEFHCTAPIKANRAQEILYGATLREYLYEQIAPALLAKGKTTPIVICTDLPELLPRDTEAQPPHVFALPRDKTLVEERWRVAGASEFDLLEPFARILEALEEAQKAARSAA